MNKKNKILELYKLGLTNKEIQEKLGFKESSIRWAINSSGLKSNRYKQFNLNSNILEFLLGSMLGDGYLDSRRLSIAHSIKQEEYCKYKYEILNKEKLVGKLCKNKIISDRYKNGYIEEYRFKSISHPVFKELRDLYYKDGIKIIPDENYLRKYLTPFAIAIWFQDDGNNCLSNLQLNTQYFTLADINKIRYILLEKYGIKTSVNKEGVITILSESVMFFNTLINPYIVNSMKYKTLPTRVLYKQGELLEHPEVDNQQPSLNSNVFEGSTTNSRILNKDSNADTSALPDYIKDKTIFHGIEFILKDGSTKFIKSKISEDIV